MIIDYDIRSGLRYVLQGHHTNLPVKLAEILENVLDAA